MLILKDIDDDGGWHITTSRTSRDGRELASNPTAALNFHWPLQGRHDRHHVRHRYGFLPRETCVKCD